MPGPEKTPIKIGNPSSVEQTFPLLWIAGAAEVR